MYGFQSGHIELSSRQQEYLSRPTASAAFWEPPDEHVLGGRDLQRSVKGTWLGVTKDGRIAVLTNFREEGAESQSLVSRGAMVNAFLTPPPQDVLDIETFVKRLISGEGARGSGGFSLVCGRIGEPLAVISNRMQKEGEVKWIGRNEIKETVGLSNAAFGDRSWKKVTDGERMMEGLVQSWIDRKVGKVDITSELMELLSNDTLPKWNEGEDWQTFIRQLRNSIFIPRLATRGKDAQTVAAADSEARVTEKTVDSEAYGTQKQTVVVVDKEGIITFTEKTLYDEHGQHVGSNPQSLRKFEFKIAR